MFVILALRRMSWEDGESETPWATQQDLVSENPKSKTHMKQLSIASLSLIFKNDFPKRVEAIDQ
jgi:hypothetical protein